MSEAQAAEEFRETARALRVLLEERDFRARGNAVLRTALAFVLIFATALLSSSTVSYCFSTPNAPGWCAIVPGSTRNSVEPRISQLEQRVQLLEAR